MAAAPFLARRFPRLAGWLTRFLSWWIGLGGGAWLSLNCDGCGQAACARCLLVAGTAAAALALIGKSRRPPEKLSSAIDDSFYRSPFA